MTAKTLFHVSLDVRDIERSSEFYARFLDRAPAKRRADYAKFELEQPGLVLTLNSAPGLSREARGGLSHLGLRVADAAALGAARTRLEAAGIAIRLEEVGVTCCYAVQDKFWVDDPDGNAWEIYRFLADAPPEVTALAGDSRAAGSTCCPGEPAPESGCC